MLVFAGFTNVPFKDADKNLDPSEGVKGSIVVFFESFKNLTK